MSVGCNSTPVRVIDLHTVFLFKMLLEKGCFFVRRGHLSGGFFYLSVHAYLLVKPVSCVRVRVRTHTHNFISASFSFETGAYR